MISVGNLEVTGSVYVHSGSIYGTASWAEIAITLSGSAENAYTASYVTGSAVNGIVNEAYTASYLLGLDLARISTGSYSASMYAVGMYVSESYDTASATTSSVDILGTGSSMLMQIL